MSKETQRSPYVLDRDIRAADALELARLMHPGPERNVRLKVASLLRCTADRTGIDFCIAGQASKASADGEFCLKKDAVAQKLFLAARRADSAMQTC
jgi:hypothetical protein